VSIIKIILKTLLGLAVSLSGLYLAYYYVSNLDTSSFLILIFSLVLIIAGIALLVRIGKSGETIMANFQRSNIVEDKSETGKAENFIEKNAKISAEWTRTVEKKDKLKTLEIAAAAEEKPAE
jgi:cell division protein FtsW (lipid II flippase)